MMNRRRFYHIVTVLLIGFLTGFVQYKQYFYRFDVQLMDKYYQREDFIDYNIKIITIDEKSIKEYGSFGTWSRDIYGQLIDLLNENGKPMIIGLDILFSGEMDSQGDQHLVDACQKHGNVFVVDNLVYSTKLILEDNVLIDVDKMNIDKIEMPFDALQKVTKQGFSNTVLDQDGYVRTHIPSVQYENQGYDSFSMAIAKEYSSQMHQEFQYPKTYGQNVFGIKYCGKNHAYEEVSLYDVLSGNIDLKTFTNSIVLVGAHAAGMQDAYNVPIEDGNQMYGVEIHANIIQSLMEGNTYIRLDSLLLSVIIGVICSLYAFLAYKLSLVKGLIVGLGLIIGYDYFAYLAYDMGYRLPLLMVTMGISIIYILTILYDYIKEFRSRRETIQVFKRYVSPQIVDDIVYNKDHQIDLNGEIRDIAVMFIDIRSFTSISEQLSGKEVVEMLNQYFTVITDIIFENNGTLDKYVGDAIMAVFNSPIYIENYELLAIKTALEISSCQEILYNYGRENFGVDLQFGIGIHCGQAVVGNIGCKQRLDFTAIGDCVNTASRIESISKGGQVLISEDLYNRVKDQVEARPLGKVRLKGKKEDVAIYEVMSIKEVCTNV